jgi:hypothetical protein
MQGDADTGSRPLIVAGCAFAGVRTLREAVLACESMAWIDAPRFVHLGHQLAGLWTRIDGRPNVSLQRSAIGALLNAMLIGRLAGSGARSWAAATEPAPSEGLDFFATLLPTARFICLHRRCDTVALSVVRARPWGISGAGATLDAYATKHPWNQATALTDYWATQTQALLAFEAAHADRCLRVRFEDIIADKTGVESRLAGFAGLPLRLQTADDDVVTGSLPSDQLPDGLLRRVNDLMEELKYEPIAC